MGLFDKFFGKSSTDTPISKTDQMIDEALYWKIIDESLKNSKSQNEQEEHLISSIEKLSPEEIIGFRLRTDRFLYDTYTSEMWCAAYIINGGCGDDSFEYFRCWLNSRGKTVYYNAKLNPDSLISELGEETEDYDFESFWYVALTAFENKTGKELYDYIANSFKYGESTYPSIKFNWNQKNDESLKAICPKLFTKFYLGE
jgi:hypothetical protein